MSHQTYCDITWLATFGLSSANVLDYFYTSPFYDQDCNNEIVRTQGVSLTHLLEMEGIEYVIDEKNSKEPNLFIIQHNIRKSPRAAEVIGVYYCLDGTLYQGPFLLDVVRTRIAKLSYYLSKSFEGRLREQYPRRCVATLVADSKERINPTDSDDVNCGRSKRANSPTLQVNKRTKFPYSPNLNFDGVLLALANPLFLTIDEPS